MKHLFSALALSFTLSGCSQPAKNLLWVTPESGSVVTGVVELQVSALQEPSPANVVFYADGIPFAKAYSEDGSYYARWASQGVDKASVTLSAKPFKGESVDVQIDLAGNLP